MKFDIEIMNDVEMTTGTDYHTKLKIKQTNTHHLRGGKCGGRGHCGGEDYGLHGSRLVWVLVCESTVKGHTSVGMVLSSNQIND